ncbi:hypothetical protein [Aquimarina aquimarini]|uniref:hypothetical protein n=1 Tax=Aquimarina aquimarini TaxID=1191734 RepID=UPI00131F1BBB|nr:hypothetical protein [Aquimarina aquimarini]
MKILKLKNVKEIGKNAQKEINGGDRRPNCVDRICMRACIKAGGRPAECYNACMLC